MPAQHPRRRRTDNPSGVHLLSCDKVITNLVDSSGVGPGDLVIDLGAGTGSITAPLAATGSRVLAVERDTQFAATLRARFPQPEVRVLHADLRTVPLPRKAFTVVSSIPFAVSTPLLRRLLTPTTGGFSAADLIVEWGLAKRLTAARPRDLEVAWWAARHHLDIIQRIPPTCFSPAPRVSAAHLRIRRVKIDLRTQSLLWFLLSETYRNPTIPIRRSLAVLTPGMLKKAGVNPATPAGQTPIARLRDFATILARDRSIPTPRLPKKFNNQ